MAEESFEISVNGTPVNAGMYGDVTSLTVEESTTDAGLMRLKLSTMLRNDGSWTYLDVDQFPLYSRVRARIGFRIGGTSGLQTVFDGYITNVTVDLGSEPGNSSIEVSALDTSVLMSLEEKITTWPNLSDSDIVQQILGSYGVQVQLDATATVHQEADTTIVQRGSDLQFVRDLAQRNGREFYFETDSDGTITAYFRTPQLDGTPQPDLAVQFGETSNLQSFSARLTGLRPLNVKTEQLDVKSNSTNTAQVGNSALVALGARNMNALVGGPLGSVVTAKDALAQMLITATPTSDATELRTVAQAVRDEASWFISATGEINSDAYRTVLRPRRLVLVKGAGRQYSGKYYVTRVRHEINVDGTYIQRFEVRRNARDLDNSEHFTANNGNQVA